MKVLDTWIWIVIVFIVFVGGLAIGFFLARKYMESYLQKNPPINEEMLRIMMMQMGQKPSQKKINQMLSMMNKSNENPKEARKKMKERNK